LYFDPTNPQWPEEATLALTLPPGIAPDDANGFRQKVGAELDRLQAQARAETQRKGVGVLGAERARQVSPMTVQRALSRSAAAIPRLRWVMGRRGRGPLSNLGQVAPGVVAEANVGREDAAREARALVRGDLAFAPWPTWVRLGQVASVANLSQVAAAPWPTWVRSPVLSGDLAFAGSTGRRDPEGLALQDRPCLP
jgi:putative transposase